MKSIENNIITHENFELFIEKLAYGWTRAQSYSSECFSSSEVSRSSALQFLLDEVVDRTEKQGYCAVATIHPILQIYDMYVHGPRPHLKQQIDDELLLDLSDLKQAFDFCEFAYKEQMKK